MEWSGVEGSQIGGFGRYYRCPMTSLLPTIDVITSRVHREGEVNSSLQLLVLQQSVRTHMKRKTAIDQTEHLITATQRDQRNIKTICFVSVRHLHDIHRPSRTVNDLDGLPSPYFYIPNIYPSYYPLQEYLKSYLHLLVEHFVRR